MGSEQRPKARVAAVDGLLRNGRYVYALTTICSGSSDALGNVCNMYGVYRSENNGAHWARSGAPALNWKAVAVSSDGQRVVAAAAGNGVHVRMHEWMNGWMPCLYFACPQSKHVQRTSLQSIT